MNELSTPTKALLLASATLMIGFSTLARCRGDERTKSGDNPEWRLKSSPNLSALNFITWPKTAFAESTDPFVIGVLGKPSPSHSEQLDKFITHPRLIQKRRVRVVRFESVEDITHCHLLFIAQSCGTDQTSAALRKVFSQSVLTVGETEGFALAGGVMNLVLGPKGRGFELNIRAAERQQLKIDGRLETLAITVDEP